MKKTTHLFFVFLSCLAGSTAPSFAVDETAANLVAFGQINLTEMNDRLNKKYPNTKEDFWNVSGIAYHNFSNTFKTDAIIGLGGYRDKGAVYNNERQLVEDAGAGFAYFHNLKGQWKLIQVELVDGKKYEGFEGADLTGQGRDQLVVYSSSGTTQIANVYELQGDNTFKKKASIAGYGLGPRVAKDSGAPLMVDFQRALINNCEVCRVYYGRPYRWDGKKFVEGSDAFLDRVQSYDPVRSDDTESSKDLEFFENYLQAHPKDFCGLANCFDLSKRLGLREKTLEYQERLAKLGDDSVDCRYCDEWLMGKNRLFQQQYLDEILGKEKRNSSLR
jgi:hypothetical protein